MATLGRNARIGSSVQASQAALGGAFLDQMLADPSLQSPWAVPWKLDYALPVDGMGDLKPPVSPALLITTDTVPDAPDTGGSTNPVLTVTGPGVTTPIVSTIDTLGDQDVYKVTLTAGVAYEIGLYSYTGGPNAVGLTDPYLELYAADGTTLLVSADGGADTVYNQVNSGFDTLLVYTPTVSGTFYVDARAFSNTPLTSTGDSVGDYQLFAREQDLNDPTVYHPYYQPTQPLYAIDWGTMVDKVNVTARNPDGDEGTRNTGNAQGTPVYTNLLDIPALAAAQGKDITGKNVITIYFAQAGDAFVSNDPTSPGLPPILVSTGTQGFEYDAVWTALHEFEKVADVVYLEVTDRAQADFFYASYTGTPGPGISLLGSMSPPGESDEGLAQFNSGDYRWNATDLQQGGFSFVTLIHEFGHGHGLAHPHDNGGHSGIMHGVEQESPTSVADYTTGDFELNQGVFTMMSYEDGWQSSPYGNAPTDVGYGYLGGLMAFDIAAIQDKYGVNEDHNTGDDTYIMLDDNAAGTYFYSIWDAGGTDEIVYYGTRDTTIDLREATLAYEVGGGGRVSYAYGIFGGFTIANGVTIENATSGGGNDTLTGNAAANLLDGGDGNDLFNLSAGGADTALGGTGNDGFYFGAALTTADSADGGAGSGDQLALQGDYSGGLTLGAANLVDIETLALLPGDDARFGDTAGNSYSYNLATLDANVAAGELLTVTFNTLRAGENVTFNGSAETDGSFLTYGGLGNDAVTGGDQNDGFFFGIARWGASDTVDGQSGSDDQLGLQGLYTGSNAVAFGAAQLAGVDTLVLLSGGDARFGSGGLPYSYEITMDDGNVGAGQTMIVNANTLLSDETLSFNGGAETNGRFTIFSGAGDDVLVGGAGNDRIFGGAGADTLYGGLGNDVFAYISAGHSTSSGRDGIQDFTSGDSFDLSAIDANALVGGNDAFSFIGAAAFSNTAGELRAENTAGPIWTVQGDIDGNGVSDFEFVVVVTDSHPLTAADFVL